MSNNIFVLQSILNNITSIKQDYLAYLNSQDLNFWLNARFNLKVLNLSMSFWIEKNLYPAKTKHFEKLCDIHYKWLSKIKEPPQDYETFLSKLNFFRKEYLQLFLEEAEAYDWGDTSLEYLIKITGYDPQKERKTFPEELRETLKELKLSN